jgi:hypothetical protein
VLLELATVARSSVTPNGHGLVQADARVYSAHLLRRILLLARKMRAAATTWCAFTKTLLAITSVVPSLCASVVASVGASVVVTVGASVFAGPSVPVPALALALAPVDAGAGALAPVDAGAGALAPVDTGAGALAGAGAGAYVANYYQTLDGDVSGQAFTHWYAAALHFGTEPDGRPYIHWNDWHPDDARFAQAWTDLSALKHAGAAVTFMVGGAGGAFRVLFADFATYYPLLRDFVRAHADVVDGLDLDVEEPVSLTDVRMLIRQLDADFGSEFVLTMAPIAAALEADVPGLGGFVYKDLWRTPEGARLDWFNVQCYGDVRWSVATLDAIVANGYPATKVVMGMLFADFPTPTSARAAFQVLADCRAAHLDLRGAYIWEHALAPLGPREWAAGAARALKPDVCMHAAATTLPSST